MLDLGYLLIINYYYSSVNNYIIILRSCILQYQNLPVSKVVMTISSVIKEIKILITNRSKSVNSGYTTERS